MRTLVVALAVGATLAAATDARAHECSRWGLGLRSTGMTISGDTEPDNALHLSGGGVQVRYRLGRRFSLELTFEGLHADVDGGRYVRDSMPTTLSLRYHLGRSCRRWDPYLLFGLGGTEDEVTYRTATGDLATATFHESHAHIGAGVERRFGRFGAGAELRFVGLARSPEEGDAPAYGERPYGPIPMDSSGGQVSVALTYYF